MLNVKRALITLVVVCAVAGTTVPAASARVEGAAGIPAVERAAKQAYRAYREARHVADATVYYSHHDYSDFAGRHIEQPAKVGRWVQLARAVGWPWPCIDRLMHIIARESSGYPGVPNSQGSGASGLLQIMPSNVGQPDRLFQAEYNLRQGLRLYREAGWSPWAL